MAKTGTKTAVNWVIAVAAAVTIGVGFVDYVYPREQGERLEKLVDHNSHRFDHILQLLLEIKGSQREKQL